MQVWWLWLHKTLTGTKKKQKKQTTRCTKPAQAPKKTKKLKFPGTMGPLLSSCWNFCFFCFFWCLSMFGASSGLVFLFFLVPVQVWWLWLHKTLTGTKKKQKFQQLLRSGPIVPGNFSFFYFFWCLCRFDASSGWFFFVFWCLCRFGASIGLFVFLMPVQVLVIIDCVCLDLGHLLNLCFKEANIPLSLNRYATTQVAWP